MRDKIVLIVLLLMIIGIFAGIVIVDKMGYLSKPRIPKTISSEDVYPKGNFKEAFIFDKQNKEKPIILSQDDADNIKKILKDANKETGDGYNTGLMELHITFSDSTIELFRSRSDSETIHYIFHSTKINAINYEFKSKELSDIILKYGEAS